MLLICIVNRNLTYFIKVFNFNKPHKIYKFWNVLLEINLQYKTI